MKKYSILLSALGCAMLLSYNSAKAQLVGTEAFLQGRYLEIGMTANGSFGTTTSPAGYHSHPVCCSTTATALGALGEVYDINHDGWTTGSPAYMGDYTYPGFPFEGWELQVDTARDQAFAQTPGYTGGLSMTGGITSYTNTGASARAVWQGTAVSGQLAITMETRVDTGASWVMMTVKLRNTGSTTLPNVYYVRTADPDIDQTWTGGGSFTTHNTITYQNDMANRVLVSATGELPGTYMGLGTTDARAKAFIYNSWPLSTTTDLATLYDETSTIGATYTTGTTMYGDIAMGIVYKLGNIAAGDSVTVSYNYAFNDTTGIDSANSTLCGGALAGGMATTSATEACSTDLVTLTLSGASAYTATAYQWQSSTDTTVLGWSDVSGATSTTYSFTGLSADTYYRCKVYCTESGAAVYSNPLLITYTPVCSCPALSAGTVFPDMTTACAASVIVLTDIGYSPTTAALQWQSSADSVSWSDITGETLPSYTFTGLTATTYYRLVVTCPGSGASTATAGQKITFDPSCGGAACSGLSAGTVNASVVIACSTTMISLNDAGYSTSGTATQWQASLDSATWSNIPATGVPYNFSGLVATTWYRLKVTCSGTGDAVTSNSKKITYQPSCDPTAVVPAGAIQSTGLYPNPATDELTITTGSNTYTSLAITNSIGQDVLQQAITGTTAIVRVQHMPAGVYYITLKGAQGKEVMKFLKWDK